MKARTRAFLVVVFLSLAGAVRNELAMAEVRYTIVDLGTLGGDRSAAGAINNLGQVVGSARRADGITNGFLWQGGAMTDLGTLGGPFGQAVCISSTGCIAGDALNADGEDRAFLWQGGVITELGVLPNGPNSSAAKGINGAGMVVGESTGGVPCRNRAVLWRDGMITELPLPPWCDPDGGYLAHAINERGQAVGWGTAPLGSGHYSHAYIWEDDTVHDLAPLPGQNSCTAFGINNSGVVVGLSAVHGGSEQAVLWREGAITNLGATGRSNSRAFAINASTQVVGYAFDTLVESDLRAFLWEDGVMQDLDDLIALGSGWTLLSAMDINDAGWIVGHGMNPDGQVHAFLLIPLHKLTVSIVNGSWGGVAVSPSLPAYPHLTPVRLTALPIPGRYFRQWEIYDPNHPGDANYVAIDANTVTRISMDADRQVTAIFKCSSGMEPVLPMLLGVPAVTCWMRRRS